MKFAALDVETANSDMSSICQIGIVHFEDGKEVDSWSCLVDPKDYFDDINVSIHGINEDTVRGAPDFKQVSVEVHRRVANQIVAIHSAFDRNAIARASSVHEVDAPECLWLNTLTVAHRAWPELGKKGYGLSALSKKFGIEFTHHNAVEDARAAGLILVRAMTQSNLDLNGWLDRVKRPIRPYKQTRIARDGNPQGLLFGMTLVFTGPLSITREEAAEIAAKAGCKVANTVTKKTNFLVVSDLYSCEPGEKKSTKQLYAEELIAKGIRIVILTESAFYLSMEYNLSSTMESR